MGGLTGLYYCRHTYYCCAFCLCCFLFLPNRNAPPSNLAADLSYCWLYLSKQAVDHFMLFAHLCRVLFSGLKCSVKQVLTADLSAYAVGAGRLLITRSMNNIPLTPRQSQVINWIAHGGVRWVERETSLCSNYLIYRALTTQSADSACSNYTICWPGRYSWFTQYKPPGGAFDLYGCSGTIHNKLGLV